jgi:hypothetical protein
MAIGIVRRRCRSVVAAVVLCLIGTTAAAQDDSTRAVPASSPVRINGYLALWYKTSDLVNPRETFRIRKADLRFSGDISTRVKWRVTLDLAKQLNLFAPPGGIDQRGRPLHDAYITYQFDPNHRVDIGQLIVPLTNEGLIAGYEIETIERSMMIAERTRGGGYGDVRETGVTARGTFTDAAGLQYQVGVYNGVGELQNATDVNDAKAVIGRASVGIPGVPQLRFGASGAYEDGPDSLSVRRRLGFDGEWRSDALTLRAESMVGRDGVLRRLGYYGLAAYRISPSVDVAARFDSWDPDRDREGTIAVAMERQWVVGINKRIDERSRWSLNVIQQNFPDPLEKRTWLLLSSQVIW